MNINQNAALEELIENFAVENMEKEEIKAFHKLKEGIDEVKKLNPIQRDMVLSIISCYIIDIIKKENQ